MILLILFTILKYVLVNYHLWSPEHHQQFSAGDIHLLHCFVDKTKYEFDNLFESSYLQADDSHEKSNPIFHENEARCQKSFCMRQT